MRFILISIVGLLSSFIAAAEFQVPVGIETQVNTHYEIFTGNRFPSTAKRAKVMSRVYPSTETHDFREGGGQFCEPSTNWVRRLKWNNGSCVDADGQEHRFIERANRWGDVLYFKCDNFGVVVRSLINERHRYGIGNPEYGETVSTRVVVNGREVGAYPGYLPNVFIAGDIRHVPTDQGISLLEKLKNGSEGKFKLETTQDGRTQFWDFKFSLRGFERAINWCTAVIDDTAAETLDESTLAVADQRKAETFASNPR